MARLLALGVLFTSAAGSIGCGDDSSSTGSGGGGGSATSGASSGQSTSASGSTSSGPGTGGGDTTTASSGSGGEGGQPPVFGHECDDADDCFGVECVEINGFRTCKAPVEEATECLEPKFDTCCDSSECDEEEICTLMPDGYCGGPAPLFANACVSTDEQCAQLDCGKGDDACAPPGVFGFRTARCLERACTGNDECTEGPGGACVPVSDPCCGTTVGFFCAYAGGGCRENVDCGEGEYCQPDFATGIASCVEGSPQCPA